MKRTIRLFAVAATLAVFAAPALAQTGAKECNDENKAAWYDTFLKNRNGEVPQQKTAYESAKTYLTSCPAAPDDQIATYLKKWVTAYEKGSLKVQFEEAFVKKDYAKLAELGKQLLADDPNNTRVPMLWGYGGFLASTASNTPMNAEAVENAQKAIQIIESGKAPESWAPFANKDQALAWLNYAVGVSKLSGDAAADALTFLLKAARYESDLKKAAATYENISNAYEKGPRAKLSEEYERLYKDKPATPESELLLANINQMIDRQIDALARAAALSSGNEAVKKAYLDQLTDLYKYRNKTDAGVSDLVASVLSKPLPEVPTPLTTLPTPAPTPATSGSQPATTPNTAAGTPANKTAAGATQPTSTAKPSPSPSPTPAKKPRARANHRRRG